MPIFRTRHQAEILAWLFLRPAEEVTLTDLAGHLGVTPGSLHAEVARLTSAGLIQSRTIGRSRLLRANTSARTARALTELLTLTYGPEVVIAEEFGSIPGAEQVAIYGSWARRYHGELGSEPADVDVMVIGQPNRSDVYEAADRAEARLQLPVNTTVRSVDAWRQESDALVITAKRDTLVVVDRGEEA
jgi:predicted nucleotidyltransferase